MNFTSSGRNIQELWTKNVRNTGTNFQYVLLERTNAFLIARSETVDKAFHFLAAMKTFALLDYPAALSLVEGGKIQKCVGIAHQRHAEAEREPGAFVCVHKYHLGYIFRRLYEKIRPAGAYFFHQRVKKVADFFDTLQKRHIFCEAQASQKISLRSSKSLIAQAFLMAIIQLEAGLAPSNSPAARLSLHSSVGFLTA